MKANQLEAKDEGNVEGETPRPEKRARTETSKQNGDDDGNSSENSEDGDTKKADKTAQAHKETTPRSQLEEGTPVFLGP